MSPSPTASHPDLVGDITCDDVIDSIDALFVLQYVGGLIDSLLCLENGYVNGDDLIDAIDAALILQYAAGLLGSLPP